MIKKIYILILLLVVSSIGFSQTAFINTVETSSPTTLQGVKGGWISDSGTIISRKIYTDTTAANLAAISLYNQALIVTSSGGYVMWFRTLNPNVWNKLAIGTIPATFNPIPGYGLLLTGTYPNITFTADTTKLIPYTDTLKTYGILTRAKGITLFQPLENQRLSTSNSVTFLDMTSKHTHPIIYLVDQSNSDYNWSIDNIGGSYRLFDNTAGFERWRITNQGYEQLQQVPHLGSAADTFYIRGANTTTSYRTAAEVRSDIGAGTGTISSIIASTGLTATTSGGNTTITNTGVTSLSGTANQITASVSTGSVTLSLPSTIITPGTLSSTGLISTGQITGVGLNGVITTPLQPNITLVGTLSAVTITSAANVGSLVLPGTTSQFVDGTGHLQATSNIISSNSFTGTSNITTTVSSATLSVTGLVKFNGLTVTGDITTQGLTVTGTANILINRSSTSIIGGETITARNFGLNQDGLVLLSRNPSGGNVLEVGISSSAPSVTFDQTVNRLNVTNLAVMGNITSATVSTTGSITVGTLTDAAGNFATYSAGGTLQIRTPAEVLNDIGAPSTTGTPNTIPFYSAAGAYTTNAILTFTSIAGSLRVGSGDSRTYLYGQGSGSAPALYLGKTISSTDIPFWALGSDALNQTSDFSLQRLNQITGTLIDKPIIVDDASGQVLLTTGAVTGTFSVSGSTALVSNVTIGGNLTVTGTSNLVGNLSVTGTTYTNQINVGSIVASSGSASSFNGGIFVTSISNIGASSTLAGFSSVSATNLSGTIATNAQPNITSVGTLNVLTVSSAITSTIGNNSRYLFNGSATTGYIYQQASNTNGSLIIGLESSTGGTLNSGSAAYASSITTGNNGSNTDLVLGASQVRSIVISGTDQSITAVPLAGTGSRAVLADVNGKLSAPVSSFKVKNNIQDIGYGLNEVMKMRPVWFEYIDKYKRYGVGRQNGNIAEDMQKIIPEAVVVDPKTGIPGINYGTGQLDAVYIKAIQELNNKFDGYKKETDKKIIALSKELKNKK